MGEEDVREILPVVASYVAVTPAPELLIKPTTELVEAGLPSSRTVGVAIG